MGGGHSSRANSERIIVSPPTARPTADDTDEDTLQQEEAKEEDKDEENDDFEDPAEKVERLARMAKAAEKRKARKRARKLSKSRMKTTAIEIAACAELKDQLRSCIVMRQETVNFLSQKFGTVPMSNCRYRLPNKKFDYDHIEVKSYALSRENDFKLPYPINVAVTYDWQNPVQTVKGTVTEHFEVLRLHDTWKIRELG